MRSSRDAACAGAGGAGVATDCIGALGGVGFTATLAAGLRFFADVRFTGAFLAGRFFAAGFLAAGDLRRAAALATLVALRFVFALAFRLVAMTASQLESLTGSSTASQEWPGAWPGARLVAHDPEKGEPFFEKDHAPPIEKDSSCSRSTPRCTRSEERRVG